MKKNEQDVDKTLHAVQNFIDPFAMDDTDHLYNITSGAPAPPNIETVVLRAEAAGVKAKEDFIKERLENNKPFFDPVKRIHLKTFSDMNKSAKLKTSRNKVIEYKQQGSTALQLLVKSQNQQSPLDLKELMTYPLTLVPYCTGTSDGFLAKTDKSKCFHFLTTDFADALDPPNNDTLFGRRWECMFYYLKELPENFRVIYHKIFDLIPKNADFIFSTDMYHEHSIKSVERSWYSCGEKLLIKGENTRKPRDWKKFLSNADNKGQLISILLKVWGSDKLAYKLKNRHVICICEGDAFLLSSEDGKKTKITEIQELSSQEETDSRVILYCRYGKNIGYKYIRVKSPDPDLFFILLHYAQSFTETTILYETGKGNKKRLINMNNIAEKYSQEECSALLGLHAFTECL